MAEPKGIILEVSISKKAFKKFLHHRLDLPADRESWQHIWQGTQRVIDFFSQALYYCDYNTKGIFLSNYEEVKGRFFCAFILKHYHKAAIDQFQEVLDLLALYKDMETCDCAIITSIVPEVDFGYKIEVNRLTKVSKDRLTSDNVDSLVDRFWSFSTNNTFPELDVAFRKRNFFYKPFRVAYKKYLQQQEEIKKPYKISRATKEAPYHLFEDFHTYDNKVFHFFGRSGSNHEVPLADPYTFKKLASVFVDKSHVFSRKLVHNGLPASYLMLGQQGTRWEYFIIPDVDAQTFTNVKPPNTLYWKDKDHVFFETNEEGYPIYKKVAAADVSSFEYLDFCFGRDKNHVFFKGDIIDIDPEKFSLNENGFIFDDKNIYHYENKLALDAATFEVVSVDSIVNPFIGNFILEDKHGTYEYEQNQGLRIIKS